MNRLSWLSALGVTVLATAPLGFVPAATADAVAQQALTWSFDKCASSPTTWVGTATGPDDTTQPLETRLTDARPSGEVLHIAFDWQIGNVYLARLTGTLNQVTGAVVMNGNVVDGRYAGSRVHETGQMYDAAAGCFAGTLHIMSATG